MTNPTAHIPSLYLNAKPQKMHVEIDTYPGWLRVRAYDQDGTTHAYCIYYPEIETAFFYRPDGEADHEQDHPTAIKEVGLKLSDVLTRMAGHEHD